MIQIRLQKGSVTIAPLPAIQPVALQTDSQSANFNSRYFFGGLASYGLEFLWSWAIQHIQRWLIVRPFF